MLPILVTEDETSESNNSLLKELLLSQTQSYIDPSTTIHILNCHQCKSKTLVLIDGSIQLLQIVVPSPSKFKPHALRTPDSLTLLLIFSL